jgi:hypothetical protein
MAAPGKQNRKFEPETEQSEAEAAAPERDWEAEELIKSGVHLVFRIVASLPKSKSRVRQWRGIPTL